ncbi:retrotransposable element ORF2 protein [Nymphaea thermarum]|nr:retrotransposable element ORF2 protein [Nymphaea thermarum]
MEVKNKIKRLQTQSESGMPEEIDEECSLKRELSRLLWLEERLWHQISKIKWMRDGDKNTKFSKELPMREGTEIRFEAISHKGRLATDTSYTFTTCIEFFCRPTKDHPWLRRLPQNITLGPTVLLEENDELLKPITEAEIKWPVMNAERDSTSGPDRFGNSIFLGKWSVMQEAVAGAIRGFFNTGRLVISINKTHIVLLPKKQGMMQVLQFRPICLCSSVLKFIIRIMEKRMQPILNIIISKSQSALCIQDSFLLSQEIVHFFQNSKKKAACVKIDLSKAYDRVIWVFLMATLCHLGFHDSWIKKLMTIVTTTKSALLINGKERMWFENERGLKQGDLLSPYLFITVMEMFTRSIQAQVNNKQIRIPSMGAGTTSTFSTLYAYDIIFFIEGRLKIFQSLKVCLNEFSS